MNLPEQFFQSDLLTLPPVVIQTNSESFPSGLRDFSEFGKNTLVQAGPTGIDAYINEFWTAKQRAAHSLHEISYRACFKPQLPRFFIERLTQPGDRVYDPFLGRGTTVVEAALLGRRVAGSDLNPLSLYLTRPRLQPPTLEQIRAQLDRIDWQTPVVPPAELLSFYHPDTLQEIAALRQHLAQSSPNDPAAMVNDWIRLVATNRLTGHSPGFFSVYTLPPNQAVTVKRQVLINQRLNQTPPRRHVDRILLKKSAALLADLTPTETKNLTLASSDALLFTQSADQPSPLPAESVALVVTSPPFLNVVDYATDNWLRAWFNQIDMNAIAFLQAKKPAVWSDAMVPVFRELSRVLQPGGHIAFEVGEIHSGKILMEDLVFPAALQAGLTPRLVLINSQTFTKTSNCWGVDNQSKGTNTNRVVLLQKK